MVSNAKRAIHFDTKLINGTVLFRRMLTACLTMSPRDWLADNCRDWLTDSAYSANDPLQYSVARQDPAQYMNIHIC